MDKSDTVDSNKPAMNRSKVRSSKFKEFKRQFELHTMLWPGVILMIIFMYIPMYGVIIAFKDFNIASGYFASPWVGFKHFQDFLTDSNFFRILKNTLAINILGLVFGFPAPIIFAILINEIRFVRFKKITQSVSYLPHFVSWVIFGGLIIRLLSVESGAVNDFLVATGILENPVPFMARPQYFWGIAIITSIMKGIGWGSIIYLAAISGVDEQLYEAAFIDGAGRFRRIWHVTLPSITGTIVIFLIFNVSGILSWGFDQIWILQNNLNLQTSEIIDTYVYKIGLVNLRFSYATAVGLMRSVIAVILLLIANTMSKRITEKGLF